MLSKKTVENRIQELNYEIYKKLKTIIVRQGDRCIIPIKYNQNFIIKQYYHARCIVFLVQCSIVNIKEFFYKTYLDIEKNIKEPDVNRIRYTNLFNLNSLDKNTILKEIFNYYESDFRSATGSKRNFQNIL